MLFALNIFRQPKSLFSTLQLTAKYPVYLSDMGDAQWQVLTKYHAEMKAPRKCKLCICLEAGNNASDFECTLVMSLQP